MMINKNFDFADVNLIPRLGIVNSRNECDTSVTLGNYQFKLPVYPSNMESTINHDIARKLAKGGFFYTMHRFLTEEQHIFFIESMKLEKLIISISIGVGNKWKDFLVKLKKLDLQPDYITIDIAHGHSKVMEDMVNHVIEIFPDSFLIAGNISTVDAAIDLESWGVNAIKCGIAPGYACTTAMATKFGSRGIQASMIEEIATSNVNIPIICDGGIRVHGDIAVALTMGAKMVMAGSMFAGFQDSSGKLSNCGTKKQYWGSASSHQSGKTNRIEGIMTEVPFKNRSIMTEMYSIKESLQSAISYAGGSDITAFDEVEYIIKNK